MRLLLTNILIFVVIVVVATLIQTVFADDLSFPALPIAMAQLLTVMLASLAAPAYAGRDAATNAEMRMSTVAVAIAVLALSGYIVHGGDSALDAPKHGWAVFTLLAGTTAAIAGAWLLFDGSYFRGYERGEGGVLPRPHFPRVMLFGSTFLFAVFLSYYALSETIDNAWAFAALIFFALALALASTLISANMSRMAADPKALPRWVKPAFTSVFALALIALIGVALTQLFGTSEFILVLLGRFAEIFAPLLALALAHMLTLSLIVVAIILFFWRLSAGAAFIGLLVLWFSACLLFARSIEPQTTIVETLTAELVEIAPASEFVDTTASLDVYFYPDMAAIKEEDKDPMLESGPNIRAFIADICAKEGAHITSLEITASADPSEKTTLAQDRARNIRAYLTGDKISAPCFVKTDEKLVEATAPNIEGASPALGPYGNRQATITARYEISAAGPIYECKESIERREVMAPSTAGLFSKLCACAFVRRFGGEPEIRIERVDKRQCNTGEIPA